MKLANHMARDIRIETYNQVPRRCPVCDTALPYDKRMNTFCSHSCAAKQNNLGVNRHSEDGQLIENCCVNCGKALALSRAIYCSSVCQQEYIHTEYISKWLSGENNGSRNSGAISRHVRRYVLEQAEHKCSQCGWGEINPVTRKSPLAIHHIDGHFDNNNQENLCVLCPNCHSLTSNYGSLNNGNGRPDHRSAS